MTDSKISWTTKTWNPTTGCDQVSPGCDHCYALTLAARLKRMGNARYQKDGNLKTSGPGFGLTLHPDKLEEPLKWRKPARVFVDSMSDLFHDDVPEDFLVGVFTTMRRAPQHQFQILTKRPRRMANLLADDEFASMVGGWDLHMEWPLPNVWLGTSVEDQKRADLRIPLLLETPAAVRFLSCEPLLGPITFRWAEWDGNYGPGWRERGGSAYHLDGLKGIHWVIAGGESGPDYRPLDLEWARTIRDECVEAGVPFFYKQGSGPRSEMHKELDGRTWSEMPDEVASSWQTGLLS